MTYHELIFHPAHNRHCRLHFRDGSSLSGVYAAFFRNEPEQIYLVRSLDLITFKPLMDAGDTDAMRRYCVKVNALEVKEVELL